MPGDQTPFLMSLYSLTLTSAAANFETKTSISETRLTQIVGEMSSDIYRNLSNTFFTAGLCIPVLYMSQCVLLFKGQSY